MKKYLFLPFLLLISSLHVSAQEWRAIGKDTQGEVYFINTKLLKYEDSDWFGVWIKYGKTGYSTYKGKRIASRQEVKQLLYIKCNSSEIATVQTVVYNSRGEVVRNNRVDYPDFSAIIPDSTGEAIASSACSLKEGNTGEEVPE
jgi:hypothetical protein